MDHFSAFLESAAPHGARRELTLLRLRSAASAERRRRRRLRFVAKACVSAVVIFAIWSVAPVTPDRDATLPLLDLAEAVEHRATSAVLPSGYWYTRTERIDRITVPPELLAGAKTHHLTFLLPSVHESWLGPEEGMQVRISYGHPEFSSSSDATLFESAGLAAVYSIGERVEKSIPLAMYGTEPVPAGGSHADVGDFLLRQVAGLGDRRHDEVKMLRIATDLIKEIGDRPKSRAAVLRAIADIPGIAVQANGRTIDVSVDYVDGDRPLRLRYEFDATTAQLVGESLAVLATVTEPGTVLWSARHEGTRLEAHES